MLTLVSLALAAESWTPTCPVADDPTVWFIFTAAPDAKPVPDYDCTGLFFDSTIACPQTLGLGKIVAGGTSPGGIPLMELRYLPYGDKTTILKFLQQPGGGVQYKPPAVAATSYAATPPPPTTDELLKMYLMQRNKASAATKNVTLHLWICPEAGLSPPMDAIEPFGMKLQPHMGKLPLY